MGKMVLIVLGVLVAAIAVFLIVVAMQPADYRIERSIKIDAPAEVVYAQVSDFHNWEAWSPWAKLDPDAKNAFDGADAGKGAIFTWSGNDKVGEGRMEILESAPNSLVRIKLDFKKPMEDTCTTEFKLKSEGEQTAVTWTMSGHNNFVGKMFCMFMDMDKMVGDDFEKGLAQIKAVAKAKAKAKSEK